MHVAFHGVRGSVPSPGPDTARYGGNTPCLTVEDAGGHVLILDAGTGLRSSGARIGEGRPIDLFLTHTHWDHIQGLPFFPPVFRADATLRIYGPDEPAGTLEATIRGLFRREVFPVPFADVAATFTFAPPPPHDMASGALTVRAIPVHHPGGAVGYAVRDAAGRTLVYVPDNELGGGDAGGREARQALLEASRGADLLVHDATYAGSETGFAGWGHSTVEEAVRLALDAGVTTLALFHHAPDRVDDAVDALLAEAEALVRDAGGRLSVMAAAEGDVIEL